MHFHPFERLRRRQRPVVVPNAASQRALSTMLDLDALQGGEGAWRAPAVLTWGNALERAAEAAMIAGHAPEGFEFVLSPDQELAVWSRIIAADGALALTAPAQVAPLARAAWRSRQLWRLPAPQAQPYAPADQQAYARWERAYRAELDALGALDMAAMLNLAADGSVPPDAHVHGFLNAAPQLAAWLERIEAASPAAPDAATRFTGHAFPDREQELYAALAWAQQTAAASPAARVVIALDEPARQRDKLARAVRDVFGADDRCFLGVTEPLSRDPLFHGLLLILDYGPVMRWDVLSALLRHPALAGADQEVAARAQFDAALRRSQRHELPLVHVLERLDADGRCPILAGVLRALGVKRGDAPRRARMVAWLEHFDACLQAAGWPGIAPGHPLAERARRSWNGLCERLYRLDAVMPAGSRGAALARLRAALGETPQRRPTPTANVFVVALDDAVVLDPTHLWLLDCAGDALHSSGRPSPLLALDAQRAAGVPGADPARDLWRARVLIETLAGRGTAHHASFAAGDGEQRLTPSPLLPALASAAITPPALYVPQAWRQTPAVQHSVEDGAGPAVSPAHAVTGGVGALAAQSACPFRAFARHRLDARVVEEPRPGLSARVKGTAVHRCLAALWRGLGDSAALHAQSAEAIDAAIEQAVRYAVGTLPAATALEHEVAVVERARLANLIGQWIDFEQTRDAFTVIACEEDYTTTWGGLAFTLRPDRIDRLADGSSVVIDYKTGRCALVDWDAPRMNEPQLPFYALTAPQTPLDAIVYAQVVAGQPRWLQRPTDPDAAQEWADYCLAWRDDLDRLAAGLAAGAAAPDPKRGAATCRVCEQALFCRLVERAGDDADETDAGHAGDVHDAGAGGRQHGDD